MVLDSSSRSVNKVGGIWFKENLNSLHVFSIEVAILVLHLLSRRREHVRPKLLHLQLLLPECLQMGYGTAKFDRSLALESFRS